MWCKPVYIGYMLVFSYMVTAVSTVLRSPYSLNDSCIVLFLADFISIVGFIIGIGFGGPVAYRVYLGVRSSL